jgi:hypothetical protein
MNKSANMNNPNNTLDRRATLPASGNSRGSLERSHSVGDVEAIMNGETPMGNPNMNGELL